VSNAPAALPLARILLAIKRSFAALNMVRGALPDILEAMAGVLHVMLAIGAHHRGSLRVGTNEGQRVGTETVSAWPQLHDGNLRPG
jgi:hypothetical protein